MSPFTDDDDVIQMRGTNNQRAYAGLMPEHHIDPEQYDAKYVAYSCRKYHKEACKGNETYLDSINYDKVREIRALMLLGYGFAPPELHYLKDGTVQQEGRHRVLAAEHIGLTHVPVFVVREL